MSDTITVGVEVDGYDVEVEICTDCIEKNIRKLERQDASRIASEDGDHFLRAKLSKFAVVNAEPDEETQRQIEEFGMVVR